MTFRDKCDTGMLKKQVFYEGTIYIATCAYNAQKTIKRCVESVLNQTYTNFIYYLCDNASNDKTAEMIEEYAQIDDRIIVSHNKVNHDWSGNLEYAQLPHNIPDNCYFCLLDADDEIAPTFFEEMLQVIKKYNLDLVACGNEFIDANTNSLIGARTCNEMIILSCSSDYSKYFPIYHQFMRTGWAKLYTAHAARSRILYSEYPEKFPRAYGGDTYNIFECLRRITRVGVYPKALYKYYVSSKSLSNNMNMQRIECDRILYEHQYDFLMDKCGYVSKRNEEFLLIVYMMAIKDTLNVLMNSSFAEKDKLAGVLEIFSSQLTKKMGAYENLGEIFGDAESIQKTQRKIFAWGAEWLLAREEVADELMESFCETGEIACAIAENARGWVFFRNIYAEFLCSIGRRNEAEAIVEETNELLKEDGLI